jgi:ABC-type uncharacterized transport system ATPase subunit
MAMKKVIRKKALPKANDGMVIRNNKAVSKTKSMSTADDGTTYKLKTKTVYDNVGTKENPKLGASTTKQKFTKTDATGKSKTFVQKMNKDGDITVDRKGVIPVRKKGGSIKNKKK